MKRLIKHKGPDGEMHTEIFDPVVARLSELGIYRRTEYSDGYQREEDPAGIRKMAAEFSLLLAGTLLGGRRADGSKWCVDGQRRRAAAIQAGYKTLPVRFFDSRGPAHEAQMFILTDNKKPLNSLDLFHAHLAEESPAAIEINQAVERCGFVIPKRANKRWPHIVAVTALGNIYKWGGDSTGLLLDTLDFIQNALFEQRGACDRFILHGVAIFIRESSLLLSGGEVREVVERTKEKCESIDLVVLKSNIPSNDTECRILHRTGRGIAFANALIALYNKRLSADRKLPYLKQTTRVLPSKSQSPNRETSHLRVVSVPERREAPKSTRKRKAAKKQSR